MLSALKNTVLHRFTSYWYAATGGEDASLEKEREKERGKGKGKGKMEIRDVNWALNDDAKYEEGKPKDRASGLSS